MPRSAPPSGKQFLLHLGDQTAVITEVGAGLRSYTVGDREALDGYGVEEMCTSARGQTFIPWPNRIADGRYRFQERDHELPLSEPHAHNAIHGLTRWSTWRLAHANRQAVSLQLDLHPQPGYPFTLRCELAYGLSASGLSVRTRATNTGDVTCPYATGAHPYLSLGCGPIDELSLRVPANCYYPTDERGIPTGRRRVDDGPHDLRRLRRIGDLQLDTAFTDLDRDECGGSSVTVCAPDGAATTLWMDAVYGYVEIFTGDSIPDVARRRQGLGVEPMTAAPNAFQTGDGLISLEPGESHTAIWELRPARP
jgi:aldose 1-epimerase